MSDEIDLSVVIPALHEGPNVSLLVPSLREVLEELGIRYEILVVVEAADPETAGAATQAGASVVVQRDAGYGRAMVEGFDAARGDYILTMDADLSHRPNFVRDLWAARNDAEVTIASRYVAGASATMPLLRLLLSRTLNVVFCRGLALPIRDMSSGFRLYRASVLRGLALRGRQFDILQEILVRAYAEGWRVQEKPFHYAPRAHGRSHARVLAFGLAYLRTFGRLWKLRNSLLAADYEDRAYDSAIPLQRYWQRARFRHVTGLIPDQAPVLDVGCGSSRIVGALPPGSVAVDILHRKLRYAKKFSRLLVQASGLQLPFPDDSFSCVVCSQLIERLPREPAILDELCRVLAPGGRLVLGTLDYDRWEWVVTEALYKWVVADGHNDEHVAHYTRRGLIDEFARRGFALEATRTILRGELILAFRKPEARAQLPADAAELVAAGHPYRT
jgi:glycosyltransferase involved in cell wall biosynthesis